MTKDVEWGPWIAHNTKEMPKDLQGDEKVQTWRVDYSVDYLPEGLGRNHEEERKYSSDANDVPWHNPPDNKVVVAYRVKKEPVVEVKREVVTIGHGVTQFIAYAKCTYTDGKLTKIHWEAEE